MPISRVLGPLPENAFVVAARDSMPASGVRVTTASTRGNLSGRGKGRGRSGTPRQVEQRTIGFGRAKGKKRPANSQATTSQAAQSSIPDLNEQIPNQDVQEVPLSQSAPTTEDIQ
jgi:hypothetical protein